MRELTKRTGLALAALTLAVALTVSVAPTYAYFTTYATAKSSVEVTLHDETEIKEEFDSWTKQITIANNPSADGATQSVFVRAKAFAGSTYQLTYSGSDKWSPHADGYYYYADPVAPGAETERLDVRIDGIPSGTDLKDGTEFNVVVIYETTPVLYDADGNPYADWTYVLEKTNAEGGDAQ